MSRVYVGNLNPRVTERELEDEFRVFWSYSKVKMVGEWSSHTILGVGVVVVVVEAVARECRLRVGGGGGGRRRSRSPRYRRSPSYGRRYGQQDYGFPFSHALS